jgi:hypothetical protein
MSARSIKLSTNVGFQRPILFSEENRIEVLWPTKISEYSFMGHVTLWFFRSSFFSQPKPTEKSFPPAPRGNTFHVGANADRNRLNLESITISEEIIQVSGPCTIPWWMPMKY